jgi:ABC-type thiamine transport system ATPase subunit
LLEVADLALDYPDFHARYTLSVPTGALCGLIGPSGGGKTTLLHAIAGFETPSSGTLRFAGRDLLPLKPSERPLSMLFQEHNLFPHLTAFQNVGLGVNPSLRLGPADRAQVEEALARVGLSGLDPRRPSELSGGQRQRVAIARALFTNPRVLIFDEATSALDYESEAIIQRNMAQICQGRTVFVIAHRLSAVRHSHRIIVMDKGQIVEAGSHEELLAKPRGLYAHLWRMQDGSQTMEGVSA